MLCFSHGSPELLAVTVSASVSALPSLSAMASKQALHPLDAAVMPIPPPAPSAPSALPVAALAEDKTSSWSPHAGHVHAQSHSRVSAAVSLSRSSLPLLPSPPLNPGIDCHAAVLAATAASIATAALTPACSGFERTVAACSAHPIRIYLTVACLFGASFMGTHAGRIAFGEICHFAVSFVDLTARASRAFIVPVRMFHVCVPFRVLIADASPNTRIRI